MAKTDAYFQFPLSALIAHANDPEAKFAEITALSIFSAGTVLWAKEDADKRVEWVNFFKGGGIEKMPGGINWKSALHLGALLAYHRLGISNGSLMRMQENYEMATARLRTFEHRHGKDALVRVPRSLVFEVRDGKGMSYREFSVLCAINSVLGTKTTPVKITLETIRTRATGYKSRAALERDALAKQPEGELSPTLLTVKQTRDTVSRLHRLGCFARSTYGLRQTFYSNRMDEEELRGRIYRSKTFDADFQGQKRLSDRELTAAIKARRELGRGGSERGQPAG